MILRYKSWLNIKQVKQAVNQASIVPIFKAGLIIERNAKLSMRRGGRIRDSKTGRFQGGGGISSEPGTPPNVQTGNLRASIKTAKDRIRQTGVSVVIGPTTSAFYGRSHEFGTRKLPPRPFMFPAMMKAIREFPKLFRNLKMGLTPSGRLLNTGRNRPLPGSIRF